MAKDAEVKDLQGRVISIRSHALRLEEELRSLRSGEVSNVQRVQEIQQQLEAARNTASALRTRAIQLPTLKVDLVPHQI